MKVNGIQLVLSSYEKGLWWDDDRRNTEFKWSEKYKSHHCYKGWGIKVGLYWGPTFFTWGKFWKYPFKDVWKCLLDCEKNPLPENFRLEFSIIGLYLSVCWHQYGFYIGLKPRENDLELGMKYTVERKF